MVKTLYCSPDLRSCIYTDVSDHLRVAVITKRDPSALRKASRNQKDERLTFLSSQLSAAHLHCTTYEKKAFAAVQTIWRLKYMPTCSDAVNRSTDNLNLLFPFHHTAVEPSLWRHKVLETILWALYLFVLLYALKHVPGELNNLQDITTRWMRGCRHVGGRSHLLSVAKHLSKTQVSMIQTAPTDPGPAVTMFILLEVQRTFEVYPVSVLVDYDGLLCVNQGIWIPDHADNVKAKVLTLKHAVQAGYRGSDAAKAISREQYISDGLTIECKDFIANRRFYLLSHSSSYVPWPLSTTLHALSPNKILTLTTYFRVLAKTL